MDDTPAHPRADTQPPQPPGARTPTPDHPPTSPTHPPQPYSAKPQPWHTATDFFCAHCRYDVSQTLADDIDTCPECGHAISRASCFQVQRSLSAWARAGLTFLWMSPLVTVPIVGGVASASTGVHPLFTLPVTYALMIALCYLGWWRVERWILPYRAPARAVARTIVVVLIQIVSALIIVGVLYAAARA